MEQNINLMANDGVLLPEPTTYRRLVGRLLYLTVTQPDINFVVNYLSQFMQSPRSSHLDMTYRVLCYLKGSINKGILLLASCSLHILGFCDSDRAGCLITRRSTSGYCTFL